MMIGDTEISDRGKSSEALDSDTKLRKQTPDADTSVSEKKPKRGVRGGLHRRAGRRMLKEYPLTETEMWNLGSLGVLSTLLIAISTFCFGAWVTVNEGVALAGKLDPPVKKAQEFIETAYLTAGIVFAVIAVVVMITGGASVLKIMSDTEHDE